MKERLLEAVKILIIEDDQDIRESVRILLEGEGFAVEEAADGVTGLKKISSTTNLVILDIMMPGMSGLKTCEEIRKVSYVPILFLTAKSSESDKLLGFMAGGDDYLIKPFSYAELFARIKALLRRQQIYANGAVLQSSEKKWVEAGNVRINKNRNEVYVNDKEMSLTETEYKLLLLMSEYPNKIFTVQNLYESVWEEPFFSNSGNTVMVHIRKLRTKIEENPQEPKLIQTIWGKGYRFG